MIDTILISLLVASLCGTGAIFLKWWDAKKTVADLKKENDDLVAKDSLSQKKITELETQNLRNKGDVGMPVAFPRKRADTDSRSITM